MLLIENSEKEKLKNNIKKIFNFWDQNFDKE